MNPFVFQQKQQTASLRENKKKENEPRQNSCDK